MLTLYEYYKKGTPFAGVGKRRKNVLLLLLFWEVHMRQKRWVGSCATVVFRHIFTVTSFAHAIRLLSYDSKGINFLSQQTIRDHWISSGIRLFVFCLCVWNLDTIQGM